jgi:hypothetical protein
MHLFHKDCISAWVTEKNENATCPHCRVKIDYDKIQPRTFVETQNVGMRDSYIMNKMLDVVDGPRPGV